MCQDLLQNVRKDGGRGEGGCAEFFCYVTQKCHINSHTKTYKYFALRVTRKGMGVGCLLRFVTKGRLRNKRTLPFGFVQSIEGRFCNFLTITRARFELGWRGHTETGFTFYHIVGVCFRLKIEISGRGLSSFLGLFFC